jgi:hypothetical protein
MINWTLFQPRNLIAVGLIVILTRFAFYSAVNALDGRGSTTSDQ